MNRNVLLLVIAIVAFVLGAIFTFMTGIDRKIIELCLFGGLTAFAAAHLP